MPSISKCLVLLCVSAVLLVAAGAFADVDALTASFIRNLGTNLGTGWDTTANPCTYSGVTCVDGSLNIYQNAEISLSGRSLTGTLPGSNGATSITKIDLSNNNGITGDFPDSWASMIRLTDLDLSNTQLQGQIPSAWNGMLALQNVKISSTKACFTFPSWSGAAMSQLKTIDFSNNYIYGITTNGFSAMAVSTTLQTLNIDGNPLCGCANAQWKSNAVMKAAAQSALASSVSDTCFSTAGASCPDTGKCLAGTMPNGASPIALVPVAAAAAFAALLALIA